MSLVRTETRKVTRQGERFIIGIPPVLAQDLGLGEGMTAHWHKVLDDEGNLVKDQAVLTFTKNGDASSEEDKDA